MGAAATLIPVTSSNVKAIGYDAAAQALHVEFHGSGTYVYEKVPPEVFDGFKAAESPGRYFAANVRGKFGHRPAPRNEESPAGDAS